MKTEEQYLKQHNKNISLPEHIIDVREYLGDNIFLMKNMDLAMTFEVSGIYDEPMDNIYLSSSLHPYMYIFSSLIKGIPATSDDGSVVIQLIHDQKQDNFAPSYDSLYPDNFAGKMIRSEEINLMRYGPISRKFYISVRWSPKQKRVSIIENFSSFITGGKTSKTRINKIIESNKIKFMKTVKNTISNGEINIVSFLDEKKYIEYVEQFLSRSDSYTPRDPSTYSEEPINRRIKSPEYSATGSGYSVPDNKNKNIRTLIFSDFSSSMVLGRMKDFVEAMPLIKFQIVWTISNGSRSLGSEVFMRKMFYSTGPSGKKIYSDIINLEDKVDQKDPRVFLTLKIILFDVSDDQLEDVQKICLDIFNVPTTYETKIAPHLISTAIIMNSAKNTQRIDYKYKTLVLSDAISFLPIYSGYPEYNGSRTMLTTNFSRVNLDFLDKGHTVVVGKSGGGKSNIVGQGLILDFSWRYRDGYIRVIDRKTSYQKLSDILGGKVIKFSEKYLRENPYSPFLTSKWDEDQIQEILNFLIASILIIDPNCRVEGIHRNVLLEAIKICINNLEADHQYAREKNEKVRPHFVWDDIVSELVTAGQALKLGEKDVKRTSDDIARWGLAFKNEGQYGFLFSAIEEVKNVQEKPPIIVYDIDGITDIRLRTIACLLISIKTNRDIVSLPLNQRKLIIFEELGVMLRGENETVMEMMNAMVLDITKTLRKQNGQAVGISNEMEDFTKTPGGRSFWLLAESKIFLPFSRAMMQQLEEEYSNAFSEGELDIIRGLEVKKGKYSQAFFISEFSENIAVSLTILLSPKLDACLTTDGYQTELYNRLVEKYIEEGRPLKEAAWLATDYMAIHHPFGKNLIK